MTDSIEELAVRLAALSGLRWKDADETGKEHYRAQANREIARREACRDLDISEFGPQ